MKLTFIDTEYSNSKNKSICQIGIISYEDITSNNPLLCESYLINPEDGFTNICSSIHGITEQQVKNKPTFPIVWKEIQKYFTNAIIVGHNVAAADLNAIYRSLVRYNIEIPEMYYICTLNMAKSYVPMAYVENYSLGALCSAFGIKNKKEHDALEDCNACHEIFKAINDKFKVNFNSLISKYEPSYISEYESFISDSELRYKISDFYGQIKGFALDGEISQEEYSYVIEWRNNFLKFHNIPIIKEIIETLENILEDGIITIPEIQSLEKTIFSYLSDVSTAPITLATQILDGMLKGILIDNKINQEECRQLGIWLYENVDLAGHFPFDKLYSLVNNVLEDGIITEEESNLLVKEINSMLNPVESLKNDSCSVEGKIICLSGNFAYGSKGDVEQYLINKGATVENSVKKNTDILIVGDQECAAFSNGTYGTKVKKAIEYNNKGCHIQIAKENDIIKN